MHRLATVHARDNQPTTNDVTTQSINQTRQFLTRRNTAKPLQGRKQSRYKDTAYLNKRLFY